MRLMLNETLEDNSKMVWEAEVKPVDKPDETYADWAIMETLDIVEGEEYDWSRVKFLEVLAVVDKPSEDAIKANETWGPRGEIYEVKVGDVLVILDNNYVMINDFVLDVVVKESN